MAGVGMSNLEIKKIIENVSNNNFKNNFVGVFASDQINYFFNFHDKREK